MNQDLNALLEDALMRGFKLPPDYDESTARRLTEGEWARLMARLGEMEDATAAFYGAAMRLCERSWTGGSVNAPGTSSQCEPPRHESVLLLQHLGFEAMTSASRAGRAVVGCLQELAAAPPGAIDAKRSESGECARLPLDAPRCAVAP